ncbi:hypothetical protein G5S52_17560 [Grimontia sp. S25]|uniref:CARDB domain-containing protein n=1 Tax=Grimontia sedimenti TaxID=2711294 RepID=A0A6M1RTU1_9GAMM|nr:CARDB domain-containing protein [Grimontia sedimenti]NGN99387.1 hypothetical protein [Grimontia sedimenti]
MTHYSSVLKTLFVLMCAATLGACNNDGKGNLVISDLQAENHKTQYGEEVTITYTFQSTGYSSGETDVQFVLVHGDETETFSENETEISEYHIVGLQTLQLKNGISRETVTFNVPESVTGGQYELIAHVDPENLIDELNENDNAPHPDDEKDQYHHVVLDIEGPPDHDHHLQNLSLGIKQLILDSPTSWQDGDEHRSDIVGHIDVRYYGEHSDAVSLIGEVEINGNWEPLSFWGATTSSYQKNLVVDLSLSDHANHIGFDLVLDEAHITDLWSTYNVSAENNVNFRLSVNDSGTDLVEADESNNHVDFSLPLYFFTATDATPASYAPESNYLDSIAPAAGIGAINYEKNFDASYGDTSKFAVTVELYGKLALVPLVDPGAVISGTGDVSAYFFNAENTLFGVSFDGSAYASGTNTGYATEMVIFNATILEDEYYTSSYSKTWEKSWEEEKVLASARFSIGPVPMSVEAGVSGSLGLEMEVGYNAELTGGGDLFSVDFGAFGRGGIDLLIASGGVQAIFNLIENTFSMESTAGFDLGSNPNIYYSITLQDAIDVISGKFGLYADLRGIKWCKKWFIPYPCGSKTTRYSLWLYQTPSVFEKTWTLLSKSGQVDL